MGIITLLTGVALGDFINELYCNSICVSKRYRPKIPPETNLTESV